MNINDEDPNTKTLCEIQANFCSVFSSAIRIQIMLLLGIEEMSVGQIADKLDISISNLSQHLRLMKDRRCVCCRKEGKHVYYRITNVLYLQAIALVRKGILQGNEG